MWLSGKRHIRKQSKSTGGVVAHQHINSNYLYGSFDYRLGHSTVTAEGRVRLPHEPPAKDCRKICSLIDCGGLKGKCVGG